MGSAARAVERAWSHRNALAWLLWPASLLFGLMAGLRRWLYRTGLLRAVTLPVPVVVVGNLVAGGAGKTPLVIALVEQLRAHGRTPGVISRGYGGSASASGALAIDTPAHDDARLIGDEPCLIRRRTGVPLAVGRDRVQAARRLIAAVPSIDVLISDDGLQHYRLARQVEIAVFDARGVGNGWLLPAGPLREPLRRLSGVDAVVHNGDMQRFAPPDLPCFGMRVTGALAYPLAGGAARPLASFAGHPVLAVAGIGQPERFFELLEAANLDITRQPLPDHHVFNGHEFDQASAQTILITEKDAVKCSARADPRIWVVPVDAQVEPGLAQLILEKLGGPTPA